MTGYRDNDPPPPDYTLRLDGIEKAIEDLQEEVKHPQLTADGAFWLSVWPRVLWPLVAAVAVAFFGAWSCNHDSVRANVEIAHANASASPTNVAVDGGAK